MSVPVLIVLLGSFALGGLLLSVCVVNLQNRVNALEQELYAMYFEGARK